MTDTENQKQVHIYWCDRCKQGTPQSTDTEGKTTCLRCIHLSQKQQKEINLDDATARHIAALDGFSNAGEKRRTKK